ncbi:hypothetical protein NQ036_11735 [Brevibacterium sp. 91QC2O2]|uniref:hypothetical protein n=1 Tax=Brevibacterium sp. 91QC2O2 TaxID=2968458 RepID=UPI00211C0BF0|nr:hypothetical protein [Brevibacterium sp. 91QC2O2]MCQ9368909.1 hypothetical protein [Brevibacterium sp. 91QC2O2]
MANSMKALPRAARLPLASRILGKAVSVQRPVVLAYLRAVRRAHPDVGPDRIARIVTNHYLWATTGSGAAVGAGAVVPGIGTAVGLGLATAETGAFLELTALYAQSLAELSGVEVADEQRANALVLGVVLGSSGQKVIRQFAQRAAGARGASRARGAGASGAGARPSAAQNALDMMERDQNDSWMSLVAGTLPQTAVNALAKKLKQMLVKKYAAGTVGSVLGTALPFGVGALVGGSVNHSMARRVASNARITFGTFPEDFTPGTDPRRSSQKADADLLGGLRRALGAGRAKRGAEAPAPDAHTPEIAEVVVEDEPDDGRPRTHRSPGGRRERRRPDIRL